MIALAPLATTANMADVSLPPSSAQTLPVSATDIDANIGITDDSTARIEGFSTNPSPITVNHVMTLWPSTSVCIAQPFFAWGDHDSSTLMKMIDEAYSEVYSLLA